MPDDGAAGAGRLTSRVGDATLRLTGTAARLSDADARAPSLLPRWSRGHVLTHLARNADGLRNLLISARTGVRIPQYPSALARDEAIEAGSGRPASELMTDLRDSAAAFAAEASVLTAANWQAEVRGMRGGSHPAWFTLWRRLSEVEIHHVDLAAGYRPADWPAPFAAAALRRAAADFAGRPDCPPAVLTDTDTGERYRIGPPAGSPLAVPTVSGPGRAVLAWLIGRSPGADLAIDPGGPLPALPVW